VLGVFLGALFSPKNESAPLALKKPPENRDNFLNKQARQPLQQENGA